MNIREFKCKQKKWKENCGNIKGVHFQIYSYLSS